MGLTIGDLDISGSINLTGSFIISGTSGAFTGSFNGDGSALTGVTGSWDGTFSGSAIMSGSVGMSGSITAHSFVGDGSGLTGVTGEWDGSHTGSATISGSLEIDGRVSQIGLGSSTFFGFRAGESDDKTNNFNTAIGDSAFRDNATGTSNTALGYEAIKANSNGSGNTAVGARSLNSNNASYNTAIGNLTLNSDNSGDYNVALGHTSLYSNTSGDSNTSIGSFSMYSNSTGNGNVALGYRAGYYTTGSSTNNIFIGRHAGPASAGSVSNKLFIGNESGSALIEGDFSTNELHINGGITASGFMNVQALGIGYSGSNLSTGSGTSETALRVEGNTRINGGYLLVINSASLNEYLYYKNENKSLYIATTSSNLSIDPQLSLVLDGKVKAGFGYDDEGNQQDAFITNYSLFTSSLSVSSSLGGVSLATSASDGTIERLKVTQLGNVGIGTTTPGEKLEVIGNISASGDLEVRSTTSSISIPASKDLTMTNTSKIIMDSDFQIYKNIGNNSIIQEGGTGDLMLLSNNEIEIKSGELGETFARFTKDAGIQLYTDNVKKFETTANGVVISGSITGSNITIGSLTSAINPAIHAKTSNTSENILLESTDTGAGSAPDLVLFRNAGAPSDNDTLGVIEYKANQIGGSNPFVYNGIYSRIIDASQQQSALTISAFYGSSTSHAIGIHNLADNTTSGAVIINPTGFAQVPQHTLQVEGTTSISSSLFVSGSTVIFNNLPTSNPNVAGQLYNDGGTLKISAG